MEIYTEIRKYTVRHWRIWLIAFIVMLIAFGYMLTNPYLTIDEELWILQEGHSTTWLLQERLGIYLQNLLYTEFGRFVPFFAEIVSLFLWSIAGFLLAGLFFNMDAQKKEKSNPFMLFIFCAYFNTLPFVVGNSMSFSMMTIQEYIGLLCAVLASFLTVYNAERDKIKLPCILGALLALTFALLCYQALIVVYITTIAGLCLLRYERKQSFRRWITQGILLCIAALGIYLILTRVVRGFFGTSNYMNTYIGWGDGIVRALFFAVGNAIRILFAIPVGEKYIYGGSVIRIITVAFVIDTIFRMTKEHGLKRKLGVFFLSAAFAISPFTLFIALGTYHMPGRALIALAVSGGFELVLILRDIRPGFWKKAAKAAALALILVNLSNMNLIYYYGSLAYNYDAKTADMIMYDIEKVGADYHNKPVVFVGTREMDSLPVQKYSTLGGSFFSWDNGSEKRMIAFIKTRGYMLMQPSAAQMAEAAEYSKEMNCWPRDGSILETESLIVVKLSEPTES